MAKIYIVAGPYHRPDIRRVIDHDCADAVAVHEMVRRLRQRGTVTANDELRIRQLVCSERYSRTPPTFCPDDIHVKLCVGGREYKIYATPRPEKENTNVLTGGKCEFDGMPDLHLQAQTRCPDGKFDHANGIEISATHLSQPDWSRN
jgi:hypothetical protein